MSHNFDELNPNNYAWFTIGKRIVCRNRDTGRMLFNCPQPTTMRQALLMGFFIGWQLSDSQNVNHIAWLENIIDQFKPEVVPMSDNDYYELLSQMDGEPLHDESLQDVLDAMDEEARQKWENEKEAMQREVERSWEKVEADIKS